MPWNQAIGKFQLLDVFSKKVFDFNQD